MRAILIFCAASVDFIPGTVIPAVDDSMHGNVLKTRDHEALSRRHKLLGEKKGNSEFPSTAERHGRVESVIRSSPSMHSMSIVLDHAAHPRVEAPSKATSFTFDLIR